MTDFLDVVQIALVKEYDFITWAEEECKGPHHENMAHNLNSARKHYEYLLNLKQRLIIRALRNKPVQVKHWR